MSIALPWGSIGRSLLATIVVLVVSIVVASALGSGLAFLGLTIWLCVVGLVAVAAVLILRGNRPLAAIGALVTAVSVLLSFFWLGDGSPLVWTVLFFAGVGLIALGTAPDTARPGAWAILLPRVAIGWALVDNAQDHFRTNWLPAVQGTGFFNITNGAANRANPAWFGDPLYTGFLKNVVVPQIDSFGALVIGGELVFGLLLAVGLFTPVASIGAMWLHLNYMFMKGFLPHGAYTDKVFFLGELFLLVTASGLIYGLDASLRRLVPPMIAEVFMGASADDSVPIGAQARPSPI